MDKIKLFSLVACFFISYFSANSQNDILLEWSKQGSVGTENYNSEIPFKYIDGYMFIDVIRKGKTYNFLFDTGAEATVIDTAVADDFSFTHFTKASVSGPLFSGQDIDAILLSSIYLADVEFINSGATIIDLKFSKAKFPHKIDGIIGSPLLKKTIWQIDYANQIIRFTNDISNFNLEKPTHIIELKSLAKGWGTETIAINIDGFVSAFSFDTGNGRNKIVSNSDALRKMARKNKKSTWEYGLKKQATDYKFIANNVVIGNMELSNQLISLENELGDKQLLGNRFFDNFLLTIDWKNHKLFLNQSREILEEELTGFELNFRPNYDTKKIEVAEGLKAFSKKHQIEKGTVLLEVNGIHVSNFSKEDLFEFWIMSWPKIIKADTLNIIISQEGKNQELVLTKK